MLLNTEVLSNHLVSSSYARSQEAARMHELNTAVRRQRQDRRNQKRTELRRWFTARRIA